MASLGIEKKKEEFVKDVDEYNDHKENERLEQINLLVKEIQALPNKKAVIEFIEKQQGHKLTHGEKRQKVAVLRSIAIDLVKVK